MPCPWCLRSSKAGSACSVIALEAEAAEQEPGAAVSAPDPDPPPEWLAVPLARRHALGARAHGLLETVVELFRKGGVVDEHVGFAREQQAERVDIGRAHAGDLPVEDRDLGVQEARVVLVDLD